MARLLSFAGAAVCALALLGCGNDTAMSKDTDKGGAPPAATGAGVPDGAIAVGNDVYMVPIARDAVGCMMYRMFSPTKAVAQAIHYRTEDGGFVMNKEEASCSR